MRIGLAIWNFRRPPNVANKYSTAAKKGNRVKASPFWNGIWGSSAWAPSASWKLGTFVRADKSQVKCTKFGFLYKQDRQAWLPTESLSSEWPPYISDHSNQYLLRDFRRWRSKQNSTTRPATDAVNRLWIATLMRRSSRNCHWTLELSFREDLQELRPYAASYSNKDLSSPMSMIMTRKIVDNKSNMRDRH